MVMIIFAVLFVVMGITISQAFMLPGFLLAGLYFVFDIFSQRDYEYMMENGQFEIDVIYGKKYRKTAHILELSNLETKYSPASRNPGSINAWEIVIPITTKSTEK